MDSPKAFLFLRLIGLLNPASEGLLRQPRFLTSLSLSGAVSTSRYHFLQINKSGEVWGLFCYSFSYFSAPMKGSVLFHVCFHFVRRRIEKIFLLSRGQFDACFIKTLAFFFFQGCIYNSLAMPLKSGLRKPIHLRIEVERIKYLQ